MPPPLIAVVDDDLATLELFDTLLTNAGYRTFLWPQGKDAHLMIRKIKPDLVILDMWMEDRNAGSMVLGLMKLDPGTRAIPVIVCSAHVAVLQARLHEFREQGDIVLEKPFAPEDLLAKITALLGAHTGS